MHLKLICRLRCNGGRIDLIFFILLRKHIPLQLIPFQIVDFLLEELDVGDSSALWGCTEIFAIDDIDTAMLLLHLLQFHSERLLGKHGLFVGQFRENGIKDVSISLLQDWSTERCARVLNFRKASDGCAFASHFGRYKRILFNNKTYLMKEMIVAWMGKVIKKIRRLGSCIFLERFPGWLDLPVLQLLICLCIIVFVIATGPTLSEHFLVNP